MRFLVCGGLVLATLAVCGGIFLAVKKKKGGLLWIATILLLVMVLLWYLLPITKFLQHTADNQIEFVHMSAQEPILAPKSEDYPPLTDEQKATVLGALRATGFAHGGRRSLCKDTEQDNYYHFVILTKSNKWINMDIYVYPDGSAAASVNTDGPWMYYAGDPTLLVKAVETVLHG